jgi:hypothetical protein
LAPFANKHQVGREMASASPSRVFVLDMTPKKPRPGVSKLELPDDDDDASVSSGDSLDSSFEEDEDGKGEEIEMQVRREPTTPRSKPLAISASMGSIPMAPKTTDLKEDVPSPPGISHPHSAANIAAVLQAVSHKLDDIRNEMRQTHSQFNTRLSRMEYRQANRRSFPSSWCNTEDSGD